MRIAIMQPYFAPYLNYFRLLSETDIFVVYDCVQFARRGYVHRNKLLDANGVARWLTLPLEHAPQDTPIEQMKFSPDAVSRMDAEMRRFPAFEVLPKEITGLVRNARGSLVSYNVALLEACCDVLGTKFNVVYSSGMGLPDDLKGEARILELCRRLQATHYLNAPGGRDLYDAEAFARNGVELEFLPEWTGRKESVLQVFAERNWA